MSTDSPKEAPDWLDEVIDKNIGGLVASQLGRTTDMVLQHQIHDEAVIAKKELTHAIAQHIAEAENKAFHKGCAQQHAKDFAEIQEAEDRIAEQVEAEKRKAEEYAAEGWAWVDEFCKLLGAKDVFEARAKLRREE